MMNFLYSLLTAFLVIVFLTAIVLIILLFVIKPLVKKSNMIKLKEAKKIVFSVDKLVEDKKETPININNKALTLYEVMEGLNHLSKEKNIEEIIIDVDHTHLSKTQIEELSPLFKKLNRKFKVKAIASKMDNIEYLTALLADNIFMFKSLNSLLTLKGYYGRYSYFKSLLAKLGVKMNVMHIGSFKATGENFNRDEMSEERKTSITLIQEENYDNFINTVKERRNIDLKDKITAGELLMVNYKEAIDLSLVDGIYQDSDLNIDYQEDTLKFNDYLKLYKAKRNKSKNIIAVISFEGEIKEKDFDKNISYKNVEEKVNKLQDIENLKGVILKINSPGGSALESEKIYQKLKTITVPVYVSMSDVCASGGYYIAMAAEKIIANPSTITGSIGVVMMYPEIEDLVNKLGIKQETVTNNDKFGMLDIFSPLNEDLRKQIIAQMENTYFEFKSHVIEARKISDEELEKIAQGRIWLGNKAKEIGLVDEIGGFIDCLNCMVNDLHLSDYKVEYIFNEKTFDLNPKEFILSAQTYENILNNFLSADNAIRCYEEYQKLK